MFRVSRAIGVSCRLRAIGVALLVGACLAVPSGWSAASVSPPSFPYQCSVTVPLYVAGGTPAGIAAAVSAARMGEPVFMTEARPYLGGDLTGPMLNMLDMDYGPDGQQLAQGVFLEIYQRLGMTFDIGTAKHVFLDEVSKEPLITLRLLTRPVAAIVDGDWIKGIIVEDLLTHRQETVCAKRIVDATDDADIAAMAGVPYALGRESSGIDRTMMSATLVFELGGVNWRQVVGYVTGRPHGMLHLTGIYRGNVWGYDMIMRQYHPTQPGVGVYDLNIGVQNNHSVLINGLLIFGVDGTDPASVADGMRRGRLEVPSLVEYLREMAPGFEHAYLIRCADYLYIRETRHIRGLYTLTAQDIVTSRVFWDAIGVASYPIDLHPYRPGELNPFAARRYVYTIPLRALVPRWIGNLLVASRSISATYEAAGSARVVPTTMEEGQAAGIASVISIDNRVSFNQMALAPDLVHDLQLALHAQGAYLLRETLAAAGHLPHGLGDHQPAAPTSIAPPPTHP
ncbi:MAG TPA: FAD-dependent oxidoreductase [bacterium]|nr:FAD-dependent oxidoreductase [bacterium]